MTAWRTLAMAAGALCLVATVPANAKTVKKRINTPQTTQYLPHPSGCPRTSFCGCGAAVRLFGKPVRSLWPVAAWRKFAKTAPAPGTVAIARHSHLFVLEHQVSGTVWRVSDYNSGGHKSRRHLRDIAGHTIVNPRSAHLAQAKG